MSTKDTYTYKQILLGLRNECLEAQRKLDELRDYVFVFDKNKDSYYFNLYDSPYDKKLPELTLDRSIPKNTLLKIIESLTSHRKPVRVFMAQDNNREYHAIRPQWFSKGDFTIAVDPLRRKEFAELAEELLNSDYAKQMTLKEQIKAIDAESIPRLVPRSYEFDLRAKKGQLEYAGREDILTFASIREPKGRWEPLTQDYLDYLTSIEFPKDAFPQYHQTAIDKVLDDDRPIVLAEEYKPQIRADFKITGDAKKLVLVNTKEKRTF